MDRFSELANKITHEWQFRERTADDRTILDALKIASEYHRVSETLGVDAAAPTEP